MSASRLQNAFITVAAGLALWMADGVSARAELLRTGGTGAALETLRRLGAEFTRIEPGTRFEIVEGLGSSGGIKALSAGALEFSISGRPLGPTDDPALKASVIARTPFGLVSSHPNPGNVRSVDVAELFGSATSVWPDGTPVRVVLRPKADIDSQLLNNYFPDLAGVMDNVRRRIELPVAATDQDNAAVAEKLAGSLTAMSLAQVQSEGLSLRFLSIDGVVPTLENFESSKYRFGKDIYMVIPSRTAPALDRFTAFLRSPAAQAILRASGSVPVLQ